MSSMAKAVADRLFRSMGYLVVPRWRVAGYPQAVYLKRLFSFLQIDCVVDVGANIGQFRDFLRQQVGYMGRIVSFEPIPRNVEVLRQRVTTDPNWHIEPVALGRVPGCAELNITAETSVSSFLTPSRDAPPQFRDLIQIAEKATVAVQTLDEYVPALLSESSSKHIYLKLDTQGFDLEVIRGARASLPHISALQTEASVVPLYEEMPDYVTTIRTLEGLGFSLSGIFSVNPDHFPAIIELDCHMINRAYVDNPGLVGDPVRSEQNKAARNPQT